MYPVIFDIPQWVPILGGSPVTSFGVCMFLAFLAAGYVVRTELRRIGQDPDRAWDFVFMAVVGGIVGAKLYYVFLNFDRLTADPTGMLFGRGGLVWYGGLIGGTALVLWEIRRRRLPLPATADAIAPSLALAYGIGRIGCFLVGDDWGRPTDSWLGIAFPNGAPATTVANIEAFGIEVDPALVERYGEVLPVHPTQLYEVGLSTLIFLFLWKLRLGGGPAGSLFFIWMALAGAERFLVEFLRAKDDRFFGILTLAQLFSLAMIATAFVGLRALRRAKAGKAA
ncbi:MAG: prolipoprotein diacylglyceryl transferase [Gemmatimonadetes bacterium]|nr:prolipoprotein diacylglyceryl transferase [Gemmatimonadota bacterium]